MKVVFEVRGHNERVLASAVIEDTTSMEVTRKKIDASEFGSISGSGSVEIETESS